MFECDVAAWLGSDAAAQDNPGTARAGLEHRAPQAGDEAQQDEYDHYDQGNAERGHERGRTAHHQAAEVVADRDHADSSCLSDKFLNDL